MKATKILALRLSVFVGPKIFLALAFGMSLGRFACVADPLGQGSQYVALQLSSGEGEPPPTQVERYGVPFIDRPLPLNQGESVRLEVGGKVKRIFLLGLSPSNKSFGPGGARNPIQGPPELIRPAVSNNGWSDPRDPSVHFFIGDQLGQIQVDYGDGTSQVFPLILGESVWWGRLFYDYPEPFPSDPKLRAALAAALRLYPPAPVVDGNYVAVIESGRAPIRSITVRNSPGKKGSVAISGITVETTEPGGILGGRVLAPGPVPSDVMRFVETKPLRPAGADEAQVSKQLEALRLALYSSEETFQGHGTPKMPPGFAGPTVSFKGGLEAEVLTNAFYANVQDIADKIGADGMYHTSTKDALSWGGYKGFGTFRYKLGRYYDASFSRDLGRSLQELAVLGDTFDAARCAEYCLKMLYPTDGKKTDLPPHWGQLINKPNNSSFENDGHGLTTLFIYKLWQRLPEREHWLRTHWADIKADGDWILWQFDHPEISGAANGLLRTTGESANGRGYSVYPDCVCMYALRALAQIATSIGEADTAEAWRQRAEKMQAAITAHYIVNDPKYGQVWTLDSAGWVHKSTVLGPLIFQADYLGFAPEDSVPEWREVNAAAYQRVIDAYTPFGFYGQAMGYGQGFVTESALLLDRMHDVTKMFDWAARQIYDSRFGSFIVPEGCVIDPTGRFWHRIGDLGNGVQEGEIVKALRLAIGVDDTRPDRLQFFPRMPFDWTTMAVEKYPLIFEAAGKIQSAHLQYKLERSGQKMKLEIGADQNLGAIRMRLGPFENRPAASDVDVNGETPTATSVEQSGDSWWVRFTMSVGQKA